MTATLRLLRTPRVLTTEELEARAVELSQRQDGGAELGGELEGLVSLRLGGEWFALPVTAVLEVLRAPVVTPVPHVPPFIAGLSNLRGEVLWALDLRAMFGLPNTSEAWSFAVVVHYDGLDALLLADKVAHVDWLPLARREPVVGTVPEEYARFFQGVHRARDGSLLTFLALHQVLNHDSLLKFRED